MKKKILLVTDVYGWTGHTQAKYTIKHLSDEFDIDMADGEEFKRTYDMNYPKMANSKGYKKSNPVKSLDDYDIIYLLFHTMLLRKDITEILKHNRKILALVSAYPTIRAGFIRSDDKNKDISKNRFLNRANKCIAMVANNIISLNDLKSIYKGETFYAPFGVDEKMFYPTRGFVEKTNSQYTVAFVGKSNPEKGLVEIIRPACEAAGVKLIDNQRNYTNALSQDEMRDFYNSADVYVVASTMDGTPCTALEAAACGLPLVSNRIGNMPELIKDSINGFLVQEREVKRYIHRLIWMKKNQRIAWEIGQEGRKKILESWTWDKVLNKNERIIFRRILK